jgi:hypothetical protein
MCGDRLRPTLHHHHTVDFTIDICHHTSIMLKPLLLIVNRYFWRPWLIEVNDVSDSGIGALKY